MADSRRQTRSTQRPGPQTDAQFWSNQPDPVLIERGQADAIRLVRSTVNPAPGTTTVSEPLEANATNTSGVPPMVFVDDEGLEEQFLTEDEYSANVLDTSANRVTTPVDTIPDKPRYSNKRKTRSLTYNLQGDPEKKVIVNTIDQFLDDNYEDVLRTSNMSKQTSAFLPVTET